MFFPGEEHNKGGDCALWFFSISFLIAAIIGVAFLDQEKEETAYYRENSENYRMLYEKEKKKSFSTYKGIIERVTKTNKFSSAPKHSKVTDYYHNVLRVRKLRDDDLYGKSNYDLQKMINLIYAHNGYRFKKKEWLTYFKKFPWYDPSTNNMSEVYDRFSNIERYNVDFIKFHQENE